MGALSVEGAKTFGESQSLSGHLHFLEPICDLNICFMAIQMCPFQLFSSVDPSLGRVDYSLMSDQTLMEMFIEGFDDETTQKYQDSEGMYLSVCKWSGIECDDDERVIGIEMDSTNVGGSLALCYVPPKVRELYIRSGYTSKLTGPVDLTCLPEGMRVLVLNDNELTGEIDVTHLPDRMVYLYLHNNQLTGEIDLTHLPDRVSSFYIEDNQLAGEIHLTHLPNGMEYLHLQNNQFTGEIDLTQLPDGLRALHLENNQFSGSLILKRLPPGIRTIIARGNQFNAVAVAESEAHATIKLDGSGVTSVVDENGRELDMKRFLK